MTAPQPHLNVAYYGPPIPPPPQQPPSRKFYRHGRQRGSSSSSCNPFTWCFCCLCDCVFSLILQILVTILVVIAVAVILFWLIFHPNVPKFHVTDAALTQFDFNSNNTLRYDLAVNMTFRNPNRRIGIYYDSIEATAFYHGERFAMREIPRFYLGHKKENNVSAEFSGQQVVVGDLSEYNSERNDGVYKIDVKLKLRIRFKVWWAKTGKFTPKIECDLKVPLHSNGTASGGSFQRTKCGFDW